MELLISDIKKSNAPLTLKEEVVFEKKDYEQVFSLKKINQVNVEAKCSNYGEIIEIEFHILANLTLLCSYSLEDVEYKMNVKETLEFSFEPLNEEIIEIKENVLNLDEHILGIIIANIPLRVIKKGAKLPSVEGVRVISEEEYEEEKQNTLDPRLSALDNWEE